MKQERKWISFMTLLHREIRHFFRILGQTLWTSVVTAFLILLVFGVGLGDQLQIVEGTTYLEFLIPGLIMTGVIQNAYNNPSFSLMLAKLYGDIEDLKISPLNTQTIVWGMTLSSALRGVLVALVIFILGEAFIFISTGEFLYPKHLFSFIFSIIMGSLIFGLIGFSVGMVTRSFEFLVSIGQFVVLPLIYLGGVFFSLDNLHPFWQMASRFNPLFYLINCVRYAMLGKSDIAPSLMWSITAIFFILSYLLAHHMAKRGSYKHL